MLVYVLGLALSVATFIMSLWCAVIVTRRLNHRTAAELELIYYHDERSKRTSDNEDKVSATYSAVTWYDSHLQEHIGIMSTVTRSLMLAGVLLLFVSAGLLISARQNQIYRMGSWVAMFGVADLCFW